MPGGLATTTPISSPVPAASPTKPRALTNTPIAMPVTPPGKTAGGFVSLAPNANNGLAGQLPGGVGAGGTAAPNTNLQQWLAGLGNGLDFFSGLSGPQLALLGLQGSGLQSQIGFANANAATQRANAQKLFGLQNQGNALNVSENQNQQEGLKRQLGYLGTQGSLLDQLLGNANQSFDVQKGTLEQQLASTGRQKDLIDQIYGSSENDARLQAGVAMRKAEGDAAARGAAGGTGIIQTRGDLTAALNSNITGLEAQRQHMGERYQNEQTGLAGQLSQLGLNQNQTGLQDKQERARLAEQKSALQTQQTTLGNKAKQLGIDSSTLKTQLDQGLARIGIDNLMTTSDLLDKLTSTNLEQRTIAEQIFRNALNYSTVFQGLPPGSFAPPSPTVPTPTAKPPAPVKAIQPGKPGSIAAPTRRIANR